MEIITDPFFYLVAIPAVLIAGVSKSGFGGGLGVMAVPLMALALSPQAAAAIMLPILCLMDIANVWAYQKNWDRRNMMILIPAALLGILVGTLSFSYLNEYAVKLIPYWYLGQFGGANFGTALVLVPVALFGTWLGLWAHDKVNEKLFYRVCYTLLFITGLKLLSDAVIHFAKI